MSLKDDIETYKDRYGLVHPWIIDIKGNNLSQNGVMYTGEYYALLSLNNELNDDDRRTFNNIINQCFVEPGLLRRSPEIISDQDSQDDCVGMLLGAYMTGNAHLAQQVISYGQKHYWIFNNVNPGTITWSSFFLRFPALIAHAHWAANSSPNLFCYIWWCISVFVAATKSKEEGMDNWRLSWAMVKVNNGRGWLAHLVTKFWYKRLFKLFPLGMCDVARYYYQLAHPFSKYWKD